MPLPELSLPPWAYNVEPAGAPLLRGAQAGSIIRQGREDKIRSSLAQRHLALQEEQLQFQRSNVSLQQQLMQEELREKKWAGDQLLEGTTQFNDWMEQYGATSGNIIGAPLPINEIAAAKAMRVKNAASQTAEGRFHTQTINSWQQSIQELQPHDPAGVAALIQMPMDPKTGRPTAQHYIGLKAITDAARAKAIGLYGQPTTSKVDLPGGQSMTFDVSDRGQRLNEAASLRAQADSVRESRLPGSSLQYQELMRQAALLERESKETIRTTDPQTGATTFEMTRGIDTGAPAATGPFATMAQQRLAGFEYTQALAADLLRNVNNTNTGPLGVVGEYGQDRLVASFLGGTFVDKERVDFRATSAMLERALERQISMASTGDRFTDEDRRVISKQISGLGLLTNATEYRTRLKSIMESINVAARIYATKTGTPVPPYAQTREDREKEYSNKARELTRQFKANEITPEQRQMSLIQLGERLNREEILYSTEPNARATKPR